MNANENMKTDSAINEDEVKEAVSDNHSDKNGVGTKSQAETDTEKNDGTALNQDSNGADEASGEEAKGAGKDSGEDRGEESETLLEPAERISQLEEALAAAEAQAADHIDRLQRTAAEFQNARRRQEKQLSDSIARAAEGVIKGIVPIMDDLDLAFKNLPEGLSVEDDPWVSGFQQIQKKLHQLLDDQGVTMIALDGEFDPNRHEAVSSEPSEDVESGQIIETLRAGYEYKERVLRPALVRVAM